MSWNKVTICAKTREELGMYVEKLGGGSLKMYTPNDRELWGNTWG